MARHAPEGERCFAEAQAIHDGQVFACLATPATLECALWPGLTRIGFRPRLGRIKNRVDRGAKRFTSQVLRAAQKNGGGLARPLARRSGRGAEKGRGHVAARLVGSRLGPRARRVVVKARLVVHAQAALGSTAAHLRYIQRDSVTREGEPRRAYSAQRDVADVEAFEAQVDGDRHEFRFIVSPEDAAEIGDLKGYTRDLLARMEADLGSKLDWVAVNHWDTDNPHTHVVLRGVDETGRDLVIARDYIGHGLRGRASELATDMLGPQTELEMRERMTREVGQERWTGLDRQLAERARDGVVDLRDVATGADGGFRRGLLVGRLQELERLGLAEATGSMRWAVSPWAEPTLRAMGERGDIIRTMQRALSGSERPLAIFDAEAKSPAIVGRIAAKGLADELQDRGYLVIDGVDGRAHYVYARAGCGPLGLSDRRHSRGSSRVARASAGGSDDRRPGRTRQALPGRPALGRGPARRPPRRRPGSLRRRARATAGSAPPRGDRGASRRRRLARARGLSRPHRRARGRTAWQCVGRASVPFAHRSPNPRDGGPLGWTGR